MIDTNILGRMADVESPQHDEVQSATTILLLQNHLLCFTPHIKREFLDFAERKKGAGIHKNGLGLSKLQAISLIQTFKTNFLYIHDSSEIDRWFDQLHQQFGGGRTVHDLNIAASMLAHEISTILTYNDKDFKPVSDAGYIHILHLQNVVQSNTH